MEKFSVLMSVYFKEDPMYLAESLKSVYESQTLKPSEIILVEDGALNEELYRVVEEYKKKYKNILKVISLKKNVGLGNALNEGLERCSNELVARMDTDDVCFPERFEKQISYLIQNPDTDVLGTSLLEFSENIENVISEKRAPTQNIDKYIKWRNPMSHPSVVFKKSKVLMVESYKEINLFEDYYLWARMHVKGFKLANLEENLLYFRVSEKTYKRRGGFKYMIKECKLQREFLNIGLINRGEYVRNILVRNLAKITPNFIRRELYLKVLRKKLLKAN